MLDRAGLAHKLDGIRQVRKFPAGLTAVKVKRLLDATRPDSA